MAIATETFMKDIILFIRNSLRANVSDPLTSRPATEQFVMTAFPKRDVRYPLITVKITNVDVNSLGMQSEVVWATLNIEVRTWARNSKESDTMTQEVINDLRQLHYGTNSTTDEKIYGFKLNSAVPVIENLGDNTVHSKVLTFVYNCILED